MQRRLALQAWVARCLSALALLVFPLGSAPAAAQQRPNVVVLLADDLGWADVGFHGGRIDTPAIDRIAREGMQLHRFYATPICSPTRAALMTGRDPIKLGVAYGVIMPWSLNGVHPNERFLPQAFRAAGYQTAIVGKWHLGHAQETYLPNQRGFEHFYGHLHTEVGYYPPFANQGGRDFQSDGKSIEADGYETDLLADEAARWIRARDKSRPFFLYMPFIAPHSPLAAPEALRQKYANLKDERSRPRSDVEYGWYLPGTTKQRRLYAAVVDAMDQAIARVLDLLDREGIAENTLVLFFSDNGGSRIYGAGGADNGPLRGGKAETFEGGIRVVAALRWPGHVGAGVRLEQTMSVMDVFPTLAAATGIETGASLPLDGVDMWPAIAAGRQVDRPENLFFAVEVPQPGSYWLTALGSEWKLVQRVEQDLTSTTVVNRLFKIDADPYETNNLAEEHPEIVAELGRKLLAWRSQHPISGTRDQMIPPPGWRAPKDWASYPIPIAKLQAKEAPGMVPTPVVGRMLDWMLGDRGRVLYEGRDAAELGESGEP